MHRSFRLRLTTLALVLLGLVAPVAAQERPRPLGDALFALYALEDMYESNPSLLQSDKFSRSVLAWHMVQQSSFLVQRQRQFDQLRRHLEKQKADPAIQDLYRGYERELDLWKDLNEQITKALEAHDRVVGKGRSLQQQRAVNTGLAFGLMSFFGGSSGEDAVLGGLLVAMRQREEDEKTLRQVEREALVKLLESVKSAYNEFLPRISALRAKEVPQFQRAAKELRTARDWQDAEFRFDKVAEPANNPFLILAAARDATANKGASVDDLFARAKACQRAAALVPGTTERGHVYPTFRHYGVRLSFEFSNPLQNS